MTDLQDNLDRFNWEREPDATNLILDLIAHFTEASAFLQKLDQQMAELTGTRLFDWVDHVSLDGAKSNQVSTDKLTDLGFVPRTLDGTYYWVHEKALLPRLCVGKANRIALKVESVVDFLAALQLDSEIEVVGGIASALRQAVVDSGESYEVWVVERHGYLGWENTPKPIELAVVQKHFESFRLRYRDDLDQSQGFVRAAERIDAAVAELGVNRACDLFFHTERIYWQNRNRAAQVQKARQDRIGMGWANHDHHTYRSSRECFRDLIACLEKLGFKCRERFYAGEQAGWGAQVLEQSACGIVIFADVDLDKDEVMGDFAHEGLKPRKEVGTVGLWCKLHGEAFLQAGMHHLECQFSFLSVQEQLKSEAIATMKPFTDFEHLKQAFTEGEVWPVSEKRLKRAVESGSIDESQAETFREKGAIGSHLEILERNDGYKGFNQTGISEIILRTDPRNFSGTS